MSLELRNSTKESLPPSHVRSLAHRPVDTGEEGVRTLFLASLPPDLSPCPSLSLKTESSIEERNGLESAGRTGRSNRDDVGCGGEGSGFERWQRVCA